MNRPGGRDVAGREPRPAQAQQPVGLLEEEPEAGIERPHPFPGRTAEGEEEARQVVARKRKLGFPVPPSLPAPAAASPGGSGGALLGQKGEHLPPSGPLLGGREEELATAIPEGARTGDSDPPVELRQQGLEAAGENEDVRVHQHDRLGARLRDTPVGPA
jgi:hypothetical protein